ncbi:hypothetical protein SLEP1_g25796 [Rubroshorea leprosula]|uniref:Uncharacterized protein n=1 Tax=Rubroshorea leprosula TaxID=152421 RepID=A0AAV5JXK5_9ROSI|nr:hypothetical protein SLEP1_g25796 [Rubroshorea leprosula]
MIKPSPILDEFLFFSFAWNSPKGQSSSTEGQSLFGDEGRFSVLSWKEVGDDEDVAAAQGLELEGTKRLNSNCSSGVKDSRSSIKWTDDGSSKKKNSGATADASSTAPVRTAAAPEEKIVVQQTKEVHDSWKTINEESVGLSFGPISIKPNGDAAHGLDREKAQETRDQIQHLAFWENIDSNSGPIKEWMGGGESREAKRRSRKAKSCAAIYRDAKVIQARTRKRNSGRSRKKIDPNSDMPKFFPTSSNQVVGESLEDSNIYNCNRGILAKEKLIGAKELWEFAKTIGVVATVQEEVILKKLEQMELRDRERCKTTTGKKEHNEVGGGKTR